MEKKIEINPEANQKKSEGFPIGSEKREGKEKKGIGRFGFTSKAQRVGKGSSPITPLGAARGCAGVSRAATHGE